MFLEIFVQRLQEELSKQNISQSSLARKIGLDRSSITHYLSGKVQPSLIVLFRIAEALDVDADYLMGHTNERKRFGGYTNQPTDYGTYVKFIGSATMSEIVECCSILSDSDQMLILNLVKRLASAYECP